MKNKGFTLVELAIVLVIIGLLIGGVLAGQTLIKEAKIRNVISQLHEYDLAVNTFFAKYNQMPGDISKASEFGVDKACSSCPVNTTITDGVSGKNGNNDKRLGASILGSFDASAFNGEVANFWMHLANTGLIKPNFYLLKDCSIFPGPICMGIGGPYPDLGYPKNALGSGIVALTGPKLEYIVGIRGGAHLVKADASTEGQTMGGNSDKLLPEDAYALDSKIDDGMPDKGIAKVYGLYSSDTNWVFEDDATLSSSDCYAVAGGSYNLSVQQSVCTLRIRASH